MTLTLFEGHRFVRIVYCFLFLVSRHCGLIFVWLLHTLKRSSIASFCDCCVFRDITNLNFPVLHSNVIPLSVSCSNIMFSLPFMKMSHFTRFG